MEKLLAQQGGTAEEQKNRKLAICDQSIGILTALQQMTNQVQFELVKWEDIQKLTEALINYVLKGQGLPQIPDVSDFWRKALFENIKKEVPQIRSLLTDSIALTVKAENQMENEELECAKTKLHNQLHNMLSSVFHAIETSEPEAESSPRPHAS
jgi:hypothetical protein